MWWLLQNSKMSSKVWGQRENDNASFSKSVIVIYEKYRYLIFVGFFFLFFVVLLLFRYLIFAPISGTELLNLRNFLSNESAKGVLYHVNEVNLGKNLRLRVGCQENQPCVWWVGTCSPTP